MNGKDPLPEEPPLVFRGKIDGKSSIVAVYLWHCVTGSVNSAIAKNPVFSR
jgi:hypothetical protein